MRNTVKRVAGIAAVGIAGSALLAGCGDDTSTDGSATTTAAASSAPTTSTAASKADPAKVKKLVLDASAFPAGYLVQAIPQGQTQDALDQALATTKNATISPAGCVKPSAIPDSIDLDDIGMTIAVKQTQTLVESVAVSPTTIAELRKAATGKCAKVSVTISVEGQKVTSTVQQKVVDAPKGMSDALVTETLTRARVGEVDTTTRGLSGYAFVHGYTVAVQAENMSPTGAEPDRAAFEEVFTKAVEKVEAQA